MRKRIKPIFALLISAALTVCLLDVYSDSIKHYGTKNDGGISVPGGNSDAIMALILAPVLAVILLAFIVVSIVKFKSDKAHEFVPLLILSNLADILLSYAFYKIYFISLFVLVVIAAVINVLLLNKTKYIEKDMSFIAPVFVVLYAVFFFMLTRV